MKYSTIIYYNAQQSVFFLFLTKGTLNIEDFCPLNISYNLKMDVVMDFKIVIVTINIFASLIHYQT